MINRKLLQIFWRNKDSKCLQTIAFECGKYLKRMHLKCMKYRLKKEIKLAHCAKMAVAQYAKQILRRNTSTSRKGE